MRQWLIAAGYHGTELPVLDRTAGNSWLHRWRREYGIVWKATGMQLKVPWKRVLSRTRTLMTNLYRRRALWKLVHGDDVSLDQKPSWFNNAGLLGTHGVRGEPAPNVRENFAQTRERYTIFTVVPSWYDYGPETDADPPHVFVLFAGKPGGAYSKRSNATLHFQIGSTSRSRSADHIGKKMSLRLCRKSCQ